MAWKRVAKELVFPNQIIILAFLSKRTDPLGPQPLVCTWIMSVHIIVPFTFSITFSLLLSFSLISTHFYRFPDLYLSLRCMCHGDCSGAFCFVLFLIEPELEVAITGRNTNQEEAIMTRCKGARRWGSQTRELELVNESPSWFVFF